MPNFCHSCTNPGWGARTLMALGCSTSHLKERTTLTGVAGRKKRAMRHAELLRHLWPLPIKKNRTATNIRTTVDRKGTCGMASIMALPVRAAPREVQDQEMIARIPAVRVPRVSMQTARIRSVLRRTAHIRSILHRTVHVQIDHIPIVHTPTVRIPTARIRRGPIQTGHLQIARIPTARIRTDRTQSVLPRTVHVQTDHMLSVPGRRRRDLMARWGRAGELDVQARTIEGFSLLPGVVLRIVEALVVQRSRVASL